MSWLPVRARVSTRVGGGELRVTVLSVCCAQPDHVTIAASVLDQVAESVTIRTSEASEA